MIKKAISILIVLIIAVLVANNQFFMPVFYIYNRIKNTSILFYSFFICFDKFYMLI